MALALFALALPIVGPLDDHHFAERSHTHQHVYFAGVPVSHQHVGTREGVHAHPDLSGRPDSGAGWPGGLVAAYFTDTTTSLSLAVMHAPYHNAPESMRPAPPRAGGDNPLEPFAAGERKLNGAGMAPPVPPPIA